MKWGLGIFLLCGSLAFAEDNPYRLQNLECSDETTCWQQIETQAQHFKEIADSGKIVTQIKTWHHKTPFVFVFIHGLFDNGKLFDKFSEEYYLIRNNAINLVLPGHAADTASGFDISVTTWFEEIKRTLDLARHLGDKIILITHSAGASLSLNEVLENSAGVAGHIMVEPALQVRPLITSIACMAQYTIKDARFTLPLARYFLNLIAADRPIPLHMGCEVKKIREEIFRKYLGVMDYPETAARFDEVVLENYKDIATQVKVPTLIVNNEIDGVVDINVNSTFAQTISPSLSTYISVNHPKEPHGTYLVKHYGEFVQIINEFLNGLSSR